MSNEPPFNCDAEGCTRPAVIAVTVTHNDGRTGGAHWCAEHNPWDALVEADDE